MPGRLPQQLDVAGTITPATDQLIIAQGAADVRRATLAATLDAAGFQSTIGTPFVPVVNQGVNVPLGADDVVYRRSGKWIDLTGRVTFTGAGTLGSVITMTVPFAARTLVLRGVGTFIFNDISVPTFYAGIVVGWASSTTVVFASGGTTNNYLGANPSIAIATNDQLGFSLTYETA